MRKIVELLLKCGHIKQNDLNRLLKKGLSHEQALEWLFCDNQIDTTVVIEEIIKAIRLGNLTLKEVENIVYVDKQQILKGVAESFDIDIVDLENYEIDIQVLESISIKQLKKYHVLILEEEHLYVSIVCDDPLNVDLQEVFRRFFPNKRVKVNIAYPSQIDKQLQRLALSENLKELIKSIRQDLLHNHTTKESSSSSAILQLINLMVENSIEIDASDIHIETTEKSCIVRQRVDGMLRVGYAFEKDIFPPLSSRVKLLANLDIAQKRKPQDGRFSTTYKKSEFDIRVSTLPTIDGESIVLRILDKSKTLMRLEDAGMSQENFGKFSKAIGAPYGILLVTGPTGSGKTTTLYGALNAIKDEKDKIITVEDPVEYHMVGLQQVQVNPTIGLNFFDVLRAILRQDPDTIMIGEIRDKETLRIAIQAALTGHLVLSTLHTNDALSAVTRVLDMGIEAYFLSGALIAIQAQRLVRQICDACKEETNLAMGSTLEEIEDFLPYRYTFYRGAGCKVCNHTGYKGREMISEVLEVSDALSRLISQNAPKEKLAMQAKRDGFISMFEDGIKKALQGRTTIEEVYRVAKQA